MSLSSGHPAHPADTSRPGIVPGQPGAVVRFNHFPLTPFTQDFGRRTRQ